MLEALFLILVLLLLCSAVLVLYHAKSAFVLMQCNVLKLAFHQVLLVLFANQTNLF